MRAVLGCGGASVGGAGQTGRMTASLPTIDDIFEVYLRAERDSAPGVTQLRIVLAESLLRECLENDGEKTLTASDRLVLEAERNCEAEGAFAPHDTRGGPPFRAAALLELSVAPVEAAGTARAARSGREPDRLAAPNCPGAQEGAGMHSHHHRRSH